MSNQQTVIMVPAKAVRQDLKTETNTIVYMPLATTENPGVVQIGNGLQITAKGLLSVDTEALARYIKIAKNGELIYPDDKNIINITIDKTDVDLGMVDNTADIDKPVSVLQQAALDKKLNKFAGVTYKDKILYVNSTGNIDYKNLKNFVTKWKGATVGSDTQEYDFTNLFVISGNTATSFIIDGSDDLKKSINDIVYNAKTGVLSFNRVNGSTDKIDLPLELIVTSGYYDASTKDLVLVLANGDSINIPLDDMLSPEAFEAFLPTVTKLRRSSL